MGQKKDGRTQNDTVDTIIARHRQCTCTVSALQTPGGRPVARVVLTGGGTSRDLAVCLDRLASAGVFPGTTLAVLDARATRMETDAYGLFLEAEALVRANVRRLAMCYLAESEVTTSVTQMVLEVFTAAGIITRVGIASTTQQSLVWLDKRARDFAQDHDLNASGGANADIQARQPGTATFPPKNHRR